MKYSDKDIEKTLKYIADNLSSVNIKIKKRLLDEGGSRNTFVTKRPINVTVKNKDGYLTKPIDSGAALVLKSIYVGKRGLPILSLKEKGGGDSLEIMWKSAFGILDNFAETMELLLGITVSEMSGVSNKARGRIARDRKAEIYALNEDYGSW